MTLQHSHWGPDAGFTNGTIDPASGTLTLPGPVKGTVPLTINGEGSVTFPVELIPIPND